MTGLPVRCAQIFNVRDFGAQGDGVRMDTRAIQSAIDVCHRAGGGVVLLPRGIYLTGPLCLRSNINLHLVREATLLGSARVEDYSEWPAESFQAGKAPYNARYLLGAENAENLSITGEGVIDGQGAVHYDRSVEERVWWPVIDKKTRPGRMILLILCKNVTIEGITCVDSPAWTFWVSGCEKVKFHGVTIRTDWRQINTDGIDIDCCRDVTIRHCHISTGDDALVLRSVDRLFPDKKICEQVTVEHCTLESNCNAVRLSYLRDGVMRNITMENITILRSRRGITCQIPAPHEVPERRDPAPGSEGPTVENVRFSNVRIEAKRPIWFWVSEMAVAKSIGNIRFENLDVVGPCASHMEGNAATPICNVIFDNVRMRLTGEGSSHEKEGRALALILRHCENVVLRNFRVEGSNPSVPEEAPLFLLESVPGCRISGLTNLTGRDVTPMWAGEDRFLTSLPRARNGGSETGVAMAGGEVRSQT